ncbi:DUF805 domain-containing protein [Pasteurella canis]|uniref:inner membrane protein YhaI n=1 Tax=Pasteurella canis TaxID=753 RepID=A0A379EUQ8_9PAST|nr:DUF805 domain-containing protein [Pasteurella canis]MXN89036.1 DUF805 domain-containing protein [Pasteurella canis]UAY78651.1 DUF805 domain-containing protein [Pasteurella canis]UEC22359.1 DUF805 domain-containing protein [Pasteurella canis]SPY32285.1 Inner membrane protein yhaI [Pasteurella canis]SUC10149.1 Inner membrane protein yhaI [Pasteurella canis]
MNWYLTVLKNYATFSGRARRKEFWMYSLIHFLIISALVFIDINLGTFDIEKKTGLISSIYVLATFLPTLAVSARRLHDINYSGWWVLLNIIPIGSLVVLIFCGFKGTSGSNRFGQDPKAHELKDEPKNKTTLVS